MMFVDTNIILRWLLGDHQELSQKAEKLVIKSVNSSLLITDIVVAEIVYVLRSTGRDRQQTSEALLLLERTPAFKYENKDLVIKVTNFLIETNLDFADCYLMARALREDMPLETFDKALQKAYISYKD